MNSKFQPFLYFLIPFAAASGSILEFSFVPSLVNGNPIPQEYGDRITSTEMGEFRYGSGGGFTPNVEVDYFGSTGQSLSFWNTGYSGLTGIAYYSPNIDSVFGLVFSADPGFQVTLESFNLGYWLSSGTLSSLTIRDSEENTVFSIEDVFVDTSSILLSPNVSDTKLTLTLNTAGAGVGSDNFGLDNIQFSQSIVPEPAALGLILSCGALGMSVLRRRRYKS